MTIRHLKLFVSVYNTRNMTETARQLYMTQPSVSQAIRELEIHYKAILFERMQHKLYPTKAADHLYAYAGKILSVFDEMERDILNDTIEKYIRIGTNYTVGSSMIRTFVEELKEKEPDAKISVKINKATVLLEMLRKNELDIILIEEQEKESDLIQEEFTMDHVALVVANDHRLAEKKIVTPADIANEMFLTREQGAGTRDQFEDAMKEQGYSIQVYWESISVPALIQAAKDGDGVAVLSYESVKEEIESGQLIELQIESLSLSRKLSIIYHKDKYLTDLLKEFIEICHDHGCLEKTRE